MLLAPLQPSSEARATTTSNYTALLSLLLQVSDIAVVGLAGAAAHWLRFGEPLALDDMREIAMGVIMSAMVFGSSPLYRNWRSVGLLSESLRILRMWSVAFAANVVLAVALKFANEVSRIWWALWYAGSLAGLIGLRVLCRRIARSLRKAGVDARTAVVVGGTPLAGRIIETFKQEQWAGVEVQGWFTTLPTNAPAGAVLAPRCSPCLGNLDTLAAYVEAQNIHEVWLALPLSDQTTIDRIIADLRHSTADIKLVPDLFGLRLLNQSIGQVAGLPVISLRASPMDGNARLLKALEDRVLASLILLVISPLLAALAIGVKLSSPGPILFRQRRHGRDGKVIEVWKFRSMRVHREAEGQVTQARKNDSRVTPFGAFLRRTSLDELPQFINVLHGTMSIVGPRPHAIEHNNQFKEIVQDYMQRHRMKPGITGWAQVNGLRGETDTLDKMARRVEYDLAYMQNWSLSQDLKIIAMTFLKGFSDKNAY
jgi:putative colanic acid biosynthesis UDP-glucose lipid carrier transferase